MLLDLSKIVDCPGVVPFETALDLRDLSFGGCCPAQEPVVAEDFSAAKRLQIYDVPDEGGESTLVCDVARDCLDDEALALRIVEEDCEAVLCGSIEESPFIILADQGCVTRYLAAGLRAQEAIAKMEAYELDMIPDFIGGTGCHSGEGCHEHPHDED